MQNKSNLKQFSTAFPAIPSQDQFGRPIAVFPGMTILDYAAITIYAHNSKDLSPEEAVKIAASLIHELYTYQSEELLQSDNLLTKV